mgnify:CR=1 FL=1
MRIGHGYDVHRLTEGRRMILGGVEIPYEKGLAGSFRRGCAYPCDYGFLIRRGGPGRYWQAFSGFRPFVPGRRQPGAAETGMSLAEKEKLPYRKY